MPVIDILGQQQLAQPATAYLQGRAMQMAYKQDQLQQKLLQMQIDTMPQQMELQKQLQDIKLMTAQAQMIKALKPDQVKYSLGEVGVGGKQRQKVAFGNDGRTYYPVGEPYEKTGQSINIKTPDQKGEDAFSVESAKSQVKDMGELRDAAQAAQQSMAIMGEGKKLLDKGIISGFAGDWRLGAARALNLGGANNTEMIANTEAYFANTAQIVFKIIGALGSSTAVSDKDREYAQAAAAGDISMNAQSMRKVMQLLEKYGRTAIKKYESERGRMEKLGKAGIEYWPKVDEPPVTPETGMRRYSKSDPNIVEIYKDGKWVRQTK
jgi:hypothetical protein